MRPASTLNELPWFQRFLRDFVPAVAFFLIVRQLIVEPPASVALDARR